MTGPARRRLTRRQLTPRAGSGGVGRRQGAVTVLVPPPRTPVQALARCLEMLRQDWQRQGHLAALWQAWPRLAGPQLAPHCRPLRLNHGRLTVGAAPGPWLQALQYHRHQLLGALRAAGFPVQEVRIEQHHATPLPPAGSAEAALVWQQHPSRVDQHGMGCCPRCGCPAPAGEMGLWGHCGFCRRAELSRSSSGPAAQ